MLSACGIASDTAGGRRSHAAHMESMRRTVAAFAPGSAEGAEWARMERGWVHGGKAFHRRMVEWLGQAGTVPLEKVAGGGRKREIGEAAAHEAVCRCLDRFGLSEADLSRARKGDPRKMLVAGLVRHHFAVSVEWVSKRLRTGRFTTVCRAMHFYGNPEAPWKREKARILGLIG